MITTIKEGGSLRAALFFCTKNPLPRMIADMGAGARPCLKIEHDLIENALKIFLSAARK